MINGQIYDNKNSLHPNLEFVGRINPLLNNTAIGSCYLIHPQFVVTATHCLHEIENKNITFHDGTNRSICVTSNIDGHDICFCKLDKPINHIQPLPIIDRKIEDRSCAILTGWGNSGKNKETHLRWAAARLIKESSNNDIIIEKGSKAPKVSKGDSGSPIIVCYNNALFSAATIRDSGFYQKCMRHFFNRPLNVEAPKLSEEVFNSIVNLDYTRRYHRNSFNESPVEEYKDAWRSLDKILVNSIK